MTARNYKLDELARAAGMSARTVRYYVQRELLPAPAFRGKDTAYQHEHLVRLRAIKRLQEAYFPLDAIAAELDTASPARIEQIADGKNVPASPAALASEAEVRHAGVAARRPDDREDVFRATTHDSARVFRRIELFPGVDLTVADDAPDRSVRLVKEMLELLEAKVKEKGSRR